MLVRGTVIGMFTANWRDSPNMNLDYATPEQVECADECCLSSFLAWLPRKNVHYRDGGIGSVAMFVSMSQNAYDGPQESQICRPPAKTQFC